MIDFKYNTRAFPDAVLAQHKVPGHNFTRNVCLVCFVSLYSIDANERHPCFRCNTVGHRSCQAVSVIRAEAIGDYDTDVCLNCLQTD